MFVEIISTDSAYVLVMLGGFLAIGGALIGGIISYRIIYPQPEKCKNCKCKKR